MGQTNIKEIEIGKEIEFERPFAGLLAGIIGAILGSIFFALASILLGSTSIIIHGLVGYFIAIVVRNHGRGKHIFFSIAAVICTIISCIIGQFIVYIYVVYLAAQEYGVKVLMVINLNDPNTIMNGVIYIFKSWTILYILFGVLFAYQNSRIKD
ncbi:hypothetical protein [Oceanirhabdus sp. W0125-5]|uniref:hypothetical protein n=1 Tax=Oceanirhabdus sp. W0125-5 TaxID=2999116 RepID=UPI0022F341EE|nr:hypothetical protein [Oceanirhabdus sp. W0125-5]WBW96420.1 hypothetical protein OW730_22400 [Oceanirhabdus sp. W0125-5]